ncbi:E3 ubiquitin-protein ligase Mdm2-like [Petromyzon marinus]|uniref:E3 ubiquitin-protein ligase Mdm2-like n=1 Tax=Petromyzon marinus TaxID=7757 RepID=UPI003F6FF557
MPLSTGMQLKPVPAMLRLLQSVGVEGDTFTWEQAYHYVGQYIKRRQLYDVERPYLVRCGGDPLGEVFGVEGFSLRDPRHSVAALFVKSFSIVTADSRRAGVNVTTTSTTSSPSCAPAGGVGVGGGGGGVGGGGGDGGGVGGGVGVPGSRTLRHLRLPALSITSGAWRVLGVGGCIT